jgi:hypothetical protein
MTIEHPVAQESHQLFRSHRLRAYLRNEEGYVLALVMLVLLVIAMMSTTLVTGITINQQHVRRDRAYTLSLGVAEAGLNQYLWMVASKTTTESGTATSTLPYSIPGNTGTDKYYKAFSLTDPYDGTIQGAYAMRVEPPSQSNSDVIVTVTGQSNQTVDVPRTVRARIGRPAFSEYVLLVNESVYIGGPLERQWHGKTHSNVGIRIETHNIIDSISSAQSTYDYYGTTKAGIWSQDVPSNDTSRGLWRFPVPPIDFNTVTSDFTRLSGLATNSGSLPYVNLPYVNPVTSGQAHGWYIKLLSGSRYQVAQVTDEREDRTWSTTGYPANKRGGYITYGTVYGPYAYPPNGVIYANDNVWVEGTGLQGRLTIASSGQLNATGKTASTSIYIIGDLTYAVKDCGRGPHSRERHRGAHVRPLHESGHNGHGDRQHRHGGHGGRRGGHRPEGQGVCSLRRHLEFVIELGSAPQPAHHLRGGVDSSNPLSHGVHGHRWHGQRLRRLWDRR